MAPPENAIVIRVDEKPSIQALERAQGYLKLPNGRALTDHSHDYKRNGTSTLFAALEVVTGKVTAAHKTRRRRIEFLDFMNDIVAAHADTAIHVILDNLNTHKPRNDRWLRCHPPTPPPPSLKTQQEKALAEAGAKLIFAIARSGNEERTSPGVGHA
jgi:hypothetical protein